MAFYDFLFSQESVRAWCDEGADGGGGLVSLSELMAGNDADEGFNIAEMPSGATKSTDVA